MVTFGNVAHPAYHRILIPDDENSAWDNLGPMRPVGVVQHTMVGSLAGTNAWFRRGSASTGLTTYGIGGSTDGASDGVIAMWNDPRGAVAEVEYTDPISGEHHTGHVSANRAGWANGGSDGLEGDGVAFVRTLGINAINRDLVSIERSDGGDITTPMSPKQFQSIVSLSAYWFDQAHVPHDQFPFNPSAGCVTHLLHKEFATKDCPHPAVYNRIDELQDSIRAVLKSAQTETPVGAPVPPPKPITNPANASWPLDWTTAALSDRFGGLVHVDEHNGVKIQNFDPKGVISNAWVARSIKEGMTSVRHLPQPYKWVDVKAPDKGVTQSTIIFDSHGNENWTLFRPSKDVAWRWIA